MRLIICILILCLCGLAVDAWPAGQEDKDLTILRLQKIIAEQSMAQLLENEKVKEYARIRANYERVLAEIEKKEKQK